MRENTLAVLILFTFLGMVGLYVGLWMAWKKYQQYAPTIQAASDQLDSIKKAGGSVSSLLSLLSPNS